MSHGRCWAFEDIFPMNKNINFELRIFEQSNYWEIKLIPAVFSSSIKTRSMANRIVFKIMCPSENIYIKYSLGWMTHLLRLRMHRQIDSSNKVHLLRKTVHNYSNQVSLGKGIGHCILSINFCWPFVIKWTCFHRERKKTAGINFIS